VREQRKNKNSSFISNDYNIRMFGNSAELRVLLCMKLQAKNSGTQKYGASRSEV
jgi:hypothetical protein